MKNEIKTALELMRLEGICKLITDNVEKETLENRYLRITKKGKVDDLEKAIRQCTKSQLIKIVDVSSEISNELILQYFDNYRYGMKPGFVLNWASGFVGKSLTKESIKTKLQSELSTYTYSEGCTFKNLKCSDVEVWIEKDIPIFEIGLNYLKKHNYIDENEKFNHVYEMVDCFAWVCSEKGFVAIYNMPPFIEKLLKKAFYSIYGIKIVGISLDKKILDTIFDSSRRKKISLTQLRDNPEMPQKATFSDSNFGEKESGILKGFSDGYSLTSCLYDEEIKGDIVTMGVNNNKGKLYINKNVTAEQFREWSVGTIIEIINYYSDILSADGADKFSTLNLFSSGEWQKLSIAKKNILKSLAIAMVKMTISGVDSIPIDISPTAFYKNFKQDAQYVLYGNCNVCNDDVVPKCSSCGSYWLTIVGEKLVCQDCAAEQRYCTCECGNNIFFDTIDDIMVVNVSRNLIEKIKSEIIAIDSGIRIDEQDLYIIQNGHLKHLKKDDYNVILPHMVNEFKPLYELSVTEGMFDEYRQAILDFDEKCDNTSKENCNKCKYNHDLDVNKCILKLFTIFEDFIPQPHQGHEFGDINLSVSVGSDSYTLQGIVKSDHQKITRSSAHGKEILSQSINGFVDKRVDLLAIIAPTIFDPQLTENIKILAKLMKKQVVFLDGDFIFRLYTLYNERFCKKIK